MALSLVLVVPVGRIAAASKRRDRQKGLSDRQKGL